MSTIKELYDQGFLIMKRSTNGTQINLSSEYSFDKILTPFDAICDDWEPVVERVKKSVTLYRHLIRDKYDYCCFTSWNSEKGIKNQNYTILKTETKTLEYDE